MGRGAPFGSAARRLAGSRWLVPVVLLAGLAAIVAGRWWATRSGLDPLAVGAAFGLALGGLAVVGVSRGARANGAANGAASATVRAAAIGVAFGLALVAIVIAGASIAGAQLVPGLGRPAAELAPWAAITVVVACAEEVLLRGRLFDAIRRAGGVVPAVLVTTIAFALMHVPLYGWHVVPLDLAVGLAFAGLRLATGSVVAPAAAHSVANLATWWL
jgi:membrane protease YdiL (CAAX protease family)